MAVLAAEIDNSYLKITDPVRRSEIPGPFLKVLWVTNIITIIKLGPDLLITAKIWNNR